MSSNARFTRTAAEEGEFVEGLPWVTHPFGLVTVTVTATDFHSSDGAAHFQCHIRFN